MNRFRMLEKDDFIYHSAAKNRLWKITQTIGFNARCEYEGSMTNGVYHTDLPRRRDQTCWFHADGTPVYWHQRSDMDGYLIKAFIEMADQIRMWGWGRRK